MRSKVVVAVSVVSAASLVLWCVNIIDQGKYNPELWQVGVKPHFDNDNNHPQNAYNQNPTTTELDQLHRGGSSSTSLSSLPSPYRQASNQSKDNLGVEQIEADFPGQYANPNNWFRQPPTPQIQDVEGLLTENEKSRLPDIKRLTQHTKARVRKIESLYGIGNNWSWLNHIENLDEEGLAPLTKWIQKQIYDHQNPVSCQDKQFYVLPNHWKRHGVGALLKRISQELALAMNANRILIFDPENSPGNTLLERDCNGANKTASLECIIEDISVCASTARSGNSVKVLTDDMFPGGEKIETPPVVQIALIESMNDQGMHPTGAFMRYWWRSQLSAYIMRPNNRTLARMLEMRKSKKMQAAIMLSRGLDPNQPPTVKEIPVPFPLPPSTLSIHIRHGDKAKEGKLISTRDYIVAAERFLHRNPLIYRKSAFVSTEDPEVIPVLHNTTGINPSQSYGNGDWIWYYSHIARVNSGPQANLQAQKNKTEALISHIMQLWMAVECDGFVGNRNSNWNKLIDALRCTLMDKCRLPYLDAGFVSDWEHFP